MSDADAALLGALNEGLELVAAGDFPRGTDRVLAAIQTEADTFAMANGIAALIVAEVAGGRPVRTSINLPATTSAHTRDTAELAAVVIAAYSNDDVAGALEVWRCCGLGTNVLAVVALFRVLVDRTARR